MGDNSFHTTVESLFKGMDSFITTKTVVGDAIHIGDTIILPLAWQPERSARRRKTMVPVVWAERSHRALC